MRTQSKESAFKKKGENKTNCKYKQSTKQTMYGICLFKSQEEAKKTAKIGAERFGFLTCR